MKPSSLASVLVVALPLAAAVAGCLPPYSDPVHDDAVAALGPEAPNVPPGPNHRPGQPCLVCHDGGGPAELVFATAGTVFQDPMNTTPMPAVSVTFTDDMMNVTHAETNCAGNFFLEAVDWLPVFPVHVQIAWGPDSDQMISHMAKTDSCAACHTGTQSPSTVQQIYLNTVPMQYPSSGCP
jgi:hypothetical protein